MDTSGPQADRDERDEGRRERAFNVPGIVVLILALLGAVHLLATFAGEELRERLILTLAFVPLRLLGSFDPRALSEAANVLPGPGDGLALYRRAMAAYLEQEPGTAPWSLLTYALLHAGSAHLLLNGAWLLAFGSPVAARLGTGRFLALLAAGAVAGALAHFAADAREALPLVGASASVSACAGAALRFAFGTRGGIPLVHLPARSLGQACRDRRVLVFVGVWIALNAAAGAGFAPGAGEGAVAWAAHLGGFAVGFLGFAAFDPVRA